MPLQKEIINKFSCITKLHTQSFNTEGKLTHSLSGVVRVEINSGKEIIFEEQIRWENESSLLMNSKNVYKWTFLTSGNIKLHHLRFGSNNPVFLVELVKSGKKFWESKEPHNCNNDLYSAKLYLEKNSIILQWKVTGPTENYSLETTYS